MPPLNSGSEFTVTEEHTLVATIKLHYDLFIPDQRETLRPHPLLIALHGYGGNKKQMMREARQLAPPGFVVASLQGFHQHLKEPKQEGGPLRYGFGWLTNFHPEESIALHHKALLDIIDSLVDERLADRERIFLLGFSQTCALNYRFAFTYPERLRGVVGICGGLPGDWETSELYSQTKASVFHLHGERDEFYPPARLSGYAAHLRMRAQDVEVKNYEAGHEIAPAMHADVHAWLQSRAKF